MKVLVKEKIADTGVDLLRENFEVELGLEMSDEELAEAIGGYDAILIRSATQMTAELIERADRLKVIGRAGTGVDNVDIPAATRRGVIVANAPESNSVAAAEHTLALMLALCRNVPQAHGSLTAGKWERPRFKGSELYGKTLGVIGFGRIGQLVAKRAQSFEMDVIAFDKFVSAERFRELGVEGVEDLEDLLGRADVITLHTPKTPETIGLIDESARRGDEGRRPARQLRPRRAGRARRRPRRPRERQAGRRGARRLPLRALHRAPDLRPRGRRRHPAPGGLDRRGPGPGRRRHRRAGDRGADRRRRHQRGQHRRRSARRRWRPWRPSCRSAKSSAASPRDWARARSTGSTVEFRGRIASYDTRLLGIAVLAGILSGNTEEPVNLVNAPQMAEERGIDLVETKESGAEDFTDLITVRVGSGDDATEVAGTGVGPRNEPYLVSVWGESFYLPFADHLAVFRYADRPGMIGRVGTAFGEESVNIISAAVGAAGGERAVMALTTDAPVREETIAKILELDDGFSVGRSVDL